VAMVADKIARIHETGAEVVCATDDSCLTHIGGALSRLRSGVRTVHLAEILASGLGAGEPAALPTGSRSAERASRPDAP